MRDLLSMLSGSGLRSFGFLYGLSWPLKIKPIGGPETSLSNYHYTPLNIPEERRTRLHRSGNLKSRIPSGSLSIRHSLYRGPGSVVGIATGYRLVGPGIENRWWRYFPHLSRLVLRPTQPPVQWVPGLSCGKERPRRDADPSPPSSAVVKKE